MNMRNFIINMLSDGSEVSIKRFVTFVAFGLLCIGLIADFFTKISFNSQLLEIFEYIVLGGFTGTTVEKFAKKYDSTQPK